jgi:hypothetical protein
VTSIPRAARKQTPLYRRPSGRSKGRIGPLRRVQPSPSLNYQGYIEALYMPGSIIAVLALLKFKTEIRYIYYGYYIRYPYLYSALPLIYIPY